MTKTLTEQWREGTLERGYYYYKTKVGAKVIGYQRFGLRFPYDYNHNTIDSVDEVLGPVPDYMDCKGLIYDSINLQDARKRIDELVQKMHILEEQLKEANEVIKDYDYYEPVLTNEGKYLRYEPNSAKAYLKKWGVKC